MAGLLTLLIGINICIFIAGILLTGRTLRFWAQEPVRWMTVLIVAFCVISFFTLGVYISDSAEVMECFSRMRFVGFAVLGPSWLLFMVSTFGGFSWLRRRSAVLLLFAPSFVTMTLAVIPGWGDLLVRNFEPFTWHEFTVVRFENGPWFPVHFAWSVLTGWLGVFYGLLMLGRVQGRKRWQILILLTGTAVSSGADILLVFASSNWRWVMTSSSTYLLAEFGLFYAVIQHRLLDLIPIARERIFQDHPDPILLLGADGVLQDFNGKAALLFSLNAQSIGSKWKEIRPAVDLTGEEILHSDSEDRVRFYQVVVDRLLEPGRESREAGSLVCFRETTKYKEIEKDLNENLEFKVRLLSMVAHDVYGIISAQNAFSANLRDYVQPEYQGFVGALTERVYHSQNLMTNILIWAKSQRVKFVPQKIDYELNVLIKEVLQHLEDSIRLRRIEVVMNSPSNPLLVSGDPVMTESVVRNIVRNAIRATPSGKVVRIAVQQIDSRVEIAVIDEGIGLSSERLQAILSSTEDFLRDFDARPRGFGLGLTIARQFVALQGGNFAMESTPGLGTRVTFSVPL